MTFIHGSLPYPGELKPGEEEPLLPQLGPGVQLVVVASGVPPHLSHHFAYLDHHADPKPLGGLGGLQSSPLETEAEKTIPIHTIKKIQELTQTFRPSLVIILPPTTV
jgi:hypothetical protein